MHQNVFEEELLAEIPHLRKYALSLTRDPSDANDLVQDCILRALENWRRFRKGTYMRRWLFTILRNRHFDGCRQRGRRGAHISLENCKPSSFCQRGPQEDWMELRECEHKLSKVRPRDQKILLLSVFSQLSQKEIAARLNVAEGTVRSRLSRTRAELRA